MVAARELAINSEESLSAMLAGSMDNFERNFSKPTAGELNSNYTKIYLTNYLRIFIKVQA